MKKNLQITDTQKIKTHIEFLTRLTTRQRKEIDILEQKNKELMIELVNTWELLNSHIKEAKNQKKGGVCD